MKKKPELTDKEQKQATEYALKLIGILKSVTQGVETIDNRKFSKAMVRLRTELQSWGFDSH